MFKICKQNDDYVIDNFKHGRFDNIVPSTSNLVDDIILSMQKMGVLDCLKESFCDKRKSNSYIPCLVYTSYIKIRADSRGYV